MNPGGPTPAPHEVGTPADAGLWSAYAAMWFAEDPTFYFRLHDTHKIISDGEQRFGYSPSWDRFEHLHGLLRITWANRALGEWHEKLHRLGYVWQAPPRNPPSAA